MLTLKMVSNGKRVCLCQCLSTWRHQASGGKGEARKLWANDGCSTVPPQWTALNQGFNDCFGVWGGMAVQGGKLVNQRSLSSMYLAPITAPQGLNKSIPNYIEVQHVTASLQGYKSQTTQFSVSFRCQQQNASVLKLWMSTNDINVHCLR